MTTTVPEPMVTDYLRELERAARALPRSQREELLVQIRDHINDALRPDATRADVRNVLDDLGRPADIVAAAEPDRVPARRGPREIFGLLLLVTGVPPIIGWLAGVALLLWSPLWTPRQKLLAMLVWPGGLVAAMGVGLALTVSSNRTCDLAPGGEIIPGSCVSSANTAPPVFVVFALVVVLIAPILVGAYLYRSAGRHTKAA